MGVQMKYVLIKLKKHFPHFFLFLLEKKNYLTTEKPRLKLVSVDELYAEPGMYRAIVKTFSGYYHIGSDTKHPEDAINLCLFYGNEENPYQVYNENGAPRILKSGLKEIL